MSKIDDDSVEDFFKNADASRFEVEYNENDWNKMAQHLDQEEERLALLRKSRGRYVLIATALLLLLATSVSVYLLNSNNTSKAVSPAIHNPEKIDSPSIYNDQTSQQNDAAQELLAENKALNEDVENNSDKTLSSEEEASKGNILSPEHAAKNRIDPEKKNNSDKIFSQQATTDRPSGVRVDEETRVSENRTGNVEETHQSISEENNLADSEPRSETPIVVGGVILGEVSEATDASTLKEDGMAGNVVSVDSLDKVKTDSTEPNEELESAENPDKKKDENIQRTPSPWMISLSLAPDFSRTPNSTFDAAVGSIGVNVSYQFAHRWNISTGMARVDKEYWGYGDEYHPPKGYWTYATNGEVPDKVEGNCLVWEIPLSLSYNVIETKRSRVFVSVGVSSYLMRSEYYEYTFEDPNPGAAEGWSTEKPSSYWFDIGSLSVGYDFRVSPTVSLGVEPYYRIPFGGMGWADIDMYSTGILFSVRYRFLKKEVLHPPSDGMK